MKYERETVNFTCIHILMKVPGTALCVLMKYERETCWNRILKAFANSLDPDEMPQNVASHLDPNYLLF
ncbi:hypothetical protein DPMN_108468 [Dreissena polymorpha]|uniref:Uncharacterized protein n=1 Tax=Dreissena polymorpha TaxID=45954 RepID=A0A9D4QM35_DREPO|nr:hypothetical protein DPMN_108468 [Dreissena polymorpha]